MSITHIDSLEKIVSLSKARGFIFQSSEIYGGLSAVYEYGPLGTELKRNIRQEWGNTMTRHNDNIVGVDAAIFMRPKEGESSGHVAGVSEPIIDDQQSTKGYRADMMREPHMLKLRAM